MKANYHTHTNRCGHADGNEEDMIQAAINTKMEVLGFSDHVPLPSFRRHLIKGLPYALNTVRDFLSFSRAILYNGKGFRIRYSEKKDHLNKIDQLIVKYEDEIKIFKGFECDYLEDYLVYYQELLENKEVDYLILGNHFYEKPLRSCFYGKEGLSVEMLYHYQDTTLKAFETGLFKYLAHPDVFMRGYLKWDEHTIKITYAICKKAKECNIVLELNAGGIRDRKRLINGKESYAYPYDAFWDIVSEVGNRVILGLDAHSPRHFNEEAIESLERFAKDKKLNVVEYIEIESFL